MAKQTPEEVRTQVQASAQSIAYRAMDQLSNNADLLHKMGYHTCSAAMSKMRSKIETALYALIEEVEYALIEEVE